MLTREILERAGSHVGEAYLALSDKPIERILVGLAGPLREFDTRQLYDGDTLAQKVGLETRIAADLSDLETFAVRYFATLRFGEEDRLNLEAQYRFINTDPFQGWYWTVLGSGGVGLLIGAAFGQPIAGGVACLVLGIGTKARTVLKHRSLRQKLTDPQDVTLANLDAQYNVRRQELIAETLSRGKEAREHLLTPLPLSPPVSSHPIPG